MWFTKSASLSPLQPHAESGIQIFLDSSTLALQDASSVPQDVNIVIGQGKHSTVAGVSTVSFFMYKSSLTLVESAYICCGLLAFLGLPLQWYGLLNPFSSFMICVLFPNLWGRMAYVLSADMWGYSLGQPECVRTQMRTGILKMISAIKIPLALSDSNPGMLFGDQKLIMEWLQSARQGVKMTNKLKKNKQKSYKYWCNRATSMLN